VVVEALAWHGRHGRTAAAVVPVPHRITEPIMFISGAEADPLCHCTLITRARRDCHHNATVGTWELVSTTATAETNSKAAVSDWGFLQYLFLTIMRAGQSTTCRYAEDVATGRVIRSAKIQPSRPSPALPKSTDYSECMRVIRAASAASRPSWYLVEILYS
jgi:hypothetical protein